MDSNKFIYQPMILLDNRRMEYKFCMSNIKIEGGYFMEFGVFNGKSINILSKLREGDNFHGFDTFEGLPEDWDMGDKIIPTGYFKLKDLPKVNKNVILYKGLFEDTIIEWKKKFTGPISFINMDCDLYSSTKTVLETLNSQIIKNTMIRFDDLMPSYLTPYPNWKNGEWKALSEWIDKYNRKVLPVSRSWKQGCTILVLE